MKILRLFLLFLFLPRIVYSQDCFEILGDFTGIDLTDYQIELENKACELRQSLPSEFQIQFKVYDFGFYLINEYAEGGFQDVWEEVIAGVSNQSAYYLVFGRQLSNSNGKSKVWIDFNLPGGIFNCIDEDDIDHIKIQIQGIGDSNSTPFDFYQTEIQAIEFLEKMINCYEICDNGIDDDMDGWIDCNDLDCIEERHDLRGRSLCAGQAVFREYPNQLFGFDDNKIKSYPTYSTPLGEGVPWKSLGIGEEDQVNVEFSDQLILNDLHYQATGIEILSGTTPQSFNETITIKGNSLTENGKIEVKDIDGVSIGGLMVKVLPAKSMILNLVLMKLPDDADYPTVNFTITEIESVLNNCFKQVNMTWTVNQIDQYEYNFDLNNTAKLDGQEDWDILHNYLRINQTPLYKNKYYPSENPSLFESTSTYILYNKIQSSSGVQTNGWTNWGSIYGVVNCSYQHNKRTMAHENGHRIGYKHPWEEFEGSYSGFEDADALMDYVNILTGYKIRAYQWTN